DLIWREQPPYCRILLQGSGAGTAGRGRDRSARRGRGAIHQGSARRLTFCSAEFLTMPVYTVHAPTAYAADFRSTDKFGFVRDGFHFWAMVLGPLWLIWKRLWLALLGWLILTVVLEVAAAEFGGGRSIVAAVDAIVAILMGLEASTLQRWTLSRR